MLASRSFQPSLAFFSDTLGHQPTPRRSHPCLGRPPGKKRTHSSGLGLEIDGLPTAGPGAGGHGFVRRGHAVPWPGLAWPPGAGPVLGMASDPVFQARPGQRPQDTAVPSCFPNDIVQKTPPLPPSSADQGTQVSGPFWGPVTLGEQDRGLRDLLGSQSLGKLLTS